MKTYELKFWRSNPQLKNGGYYTTRIIEAKTLVAAKKKAREISLNCVYGSFDLISVEEVKKS